jgi:hypothetical protein
MSTPHIANHIQHPELVKGNVLHVVATISNPMGYHSRCRLFRQFQAEMEATKNVVLYVVEVAFGNHAFEVTSADNPRHLQLRTSQALWCKENAIDLGIRHLVPVDAEYLCWADGDITFRNPEWAQETIHKLQHYHVVQPWQHCIDLGPHGEVMKTYDSFCSLAAKGAPLQVKWGGPYTPGHSGYAWACTRYFYENVGKLIDFAVLGSADHHMAWAMVGRAQDVIQDYGGAAYWTRVLEWQQKAFRVTKGSVGYVHGRIEHAFHGSKAKRAYGTRKALLEKCGFDPNRDLTYDAQGLIVLDNHKLEAAIRTYLSARDEDSTEA